MGETGGLYRVIYDPEQQRALVRGIIDGYCRVLEELTDAAGQAEAVACVPALPIDIGDQLEECVFTFKHPAFRAEHEWRIVYLQQRRREPVLFRAVAATLVPYLALRPSVRTDAFADQIPIAEVIVGPNQHPGLAAGAVRALLASCGYAPAVTGVRSSTIPLRS